MHATYLLAQPDGRSLYHFPHSLGVSPPHCNCGPILPRCEQLWSELKHFPKISPSNYFQGFDLSLHSAYCSFWAATKEALFKSGQALQRALKFSVRTCYSFLKGIAITLYEFLEEEQLSSHASAVGLASPGSGTVRGGGLEFGDTFEKQDFGTAQGNGPEIGDSLQEQGTHPQNGIARSTRAENVLDVLDWTTSVGFLRVEADMPTGGDSLCSEANVPVMDAVHVPVVDVIDVPVVDAVDISSCSVDHGVATDIVVHAGSGSQTFLS